MSRQVHVINYETPMEYTAMLQRQETTRDALAAGKAPNTVFLLEHTPTITLGRRALTEHICADDAMLERLGIQVINTDRGGDVTYHGPGQLVAYPVLDLNQWRPSVDWYLRAMEDTLIALLRKYGLNGRRVAGYTGVWVEDAKVAAIGISLRHWVSWHGLALNINPDEIHWSTIIPCGIKDKPVTSLARLLDRPVDMAEVKARFIQAFEEVFSCEAEYHEG